VVCECRRRLKSPIKTLCNTNTANNSAIHSDTEVMHPGVLLVVRPIRGLFCRTGAAYLLQLWRKSDCQLLGLSSRSRLRQCLLSGRHFNAVRGGAPSPYAPPRVNGGEPSAELDRQPATWFELHHPGKSYFQGYIPADPEPIPGPGISLLHGVK